MNILFYFGGFSPIGGIETSGRNLLLELKRRGLKAALVCWGARTALLAQLASAGITIVRMPWRWGCRFHVPDWLMLPMSIGLIAKADVVLFGKFAPTGIIVILRKLVRDDTKFVFITPYRPEVPLDEKARITVKAQYDAYDCVWVQSALFAENLRAIGYTKPVNVIPYMPEPKRPLRPFPPLPIRIGFLGRLVEDKNPFLLLDAFAASVKSGAVSPNWTKRAFLDLAGDGPLREKLKLHVKELSLEGRVNFCGALPQSDIAGFVQSCHLFVFTSRTEGQCLAALEILSNGRPIIATRVGAFPEILCDGRLGRLVEEPRAERVADHIRETVDSILSGRITTASVRSAYDAVFDGERIGDEYVRLLRLHARAGGSGCV